LRQCVADWESYKPALTILVIEENPKYTSRLNLGSYEGYSLGSTDTTIQICSTDYCEPVSLYSCGKNSNFHNSSIIDNSPAINIPTMALLEDLNDLDFLLNTGRGTEVIPEEQDF
jgi:hypothetical protein